ncbi:sulfotransferase [Aurantibacter sp.]|uniref:sulfotransferase n=1 Tax=Aurantibacter sp. TaxID=2807103 RepID=UPI0035C7F648
MKVNKPDFLIVGAPKAGTTSLHYYLSNHPEVYMSTPKDTGVFLNLAKIKEYRGEEDIRPPKGNFPTIESFFKIFENKKENQIAGEASIGNLYFHKEVIPLIKEHLGDVKIIISLRDPIARAFSAYAMQVRDSREHLSFSDSLEKEEERKKRNFEYIWYFRSCSMYYDQVKAYKDNFSDVKVVISEDFYIDKDKYINDIFEFLNVSKNLQLDLETNLNQSGVPKNRQLHKWLVMKNKFRAVRLILPRNLRIYIYKNFLRDFIGYDKLKYNNEKLEYLLSFIQDDVVKLSELLDRDLNSFWLDKYKK